MTPSNQQKPLVDVAKMIIDLVHSHHSDCGALIVSDILIRQVTEALDESRKQDIETGVSPRNQGELGERAVPSDAEFLVEAERAYNQCAEQFVSDYRSWMACARWAVQCLGMKGAKPDTTERDRSDQEEGSW